MSGFDWLRAQIIEQGRTLQGIGTEATRLAEQIVDEERGLDDRVGRGVLLPGQRAERVQELRAQADRTLESLIVRRDQAVATADDHRQSALRSAIKRADSVARDRARALLAEKGFGGAADAAQRVTEPSVIAALADEARYDDRAPDGLLDALTARLAEMGDGALAESERARTAAQVAGTGLSMLAGVVQGQGLGALARNRIRAAHAGAS
jgi:hypothetical protein